MNSEKAKEMKSSVKKPINKQLAVIIAVAAAALILIFVYFLVIRPLVSKNDSKTDSTEIKLIWQNEINYANRYLMLYEFVERDGIERVDIHNPSNADKYGKRYVDWGIYRYHSEGDDSKYDDDHLYLIDYEFIPFEDTMLSYFVNSAGMPICSSRIEDHCTDYAKYGLDFENEEDALYYTLTTTAGKSYKVYIGSMLPSGNGYYARVGGTDINLETGAEAERDSVYVLTNLYIGSTLLSYPAAIADTYITYPLSASTNAAFKEFVLSDTYLNTVFSAKPHAAVSEDPFALFAGSSIYYTELPAGYYASPAFEDLASKFKEFKGSAVVELAERMTDDEGNQYYGFDEETLAKYGLDYLHMRYILLFNNDGIINEVEFSDLIDNSYYYAYSQVWNSIVKVSYETAAFLNWDYSTYINTAVMGLSIYNCESLSIKGTYNDLGIEVPERKGIQNVDESFGVSGTMNSITVTNRKTGEEVQRQNFSRLFLQILYMNLRERLPEEEVENIMNTVDPSCTLSVVTRANTVYKYDASGNETNEIDYTLPSVTRVFRFYRYTGGRSLVTIESIDEKGISSGEIGSYYMMASKVDQILSSAVSVANGIEIEGNDRY